jgi:hypothetical protein
MSAVRPSTVLTIPLLKACTIKNKTIAYVAKSVTGGNSNFVSAGGVVAVFENNGILWSDSNTYGCFQLNPHDSYKDREWEYNRNSGCFS